MSVEKILNRLNKPGANLLDLLNVYRNDEESRADWTADPRLYRAFAKALIEAGNPTRAFDLVRSGLDAHPDDEKLEYLGALALRRGGNIQQATVYANKLLARADISAEIRIEAVSLIGSIKKEQYILTNRTDPALARASAELYLQARDLSPVYPACFPAINAATMLYMADEKERARELAGAVRDRAMIDQANPENDRDYWLKATIGEALLILGELKEASLWYGRAVAQARAEGKAGVLGSIRKNFQLLRHKIPVDEAEWGFLKDIGNVVAFAGHMIDHPARRIATDQPLRFPNDPDLIERVEAEIERHLEEINASIGYCSVACGADILFAERMLERKAELHIVLPFDLDDFYGTSVDFGLPDGDRMKVWRKRCDVVLDKVGRDNIHHATKEKYLDDDVLFSFANTFIQGLAILRAAERGVEPHALVVLDDPGPREPAEGGTADFLARWKTRGLDGRVIDLPRLREEAGVFAVGPGRVVEPPVSAAPPVARVRRKIMVMLFADVKNFSKLDDDRYPDFFATFLVEVKRVLDEKTPAPAFVNTWGDGLYVVFDRVVDGADFALRLVDRVKNVDWKGKRLPPDTTVRIGIHAGPVYKRMDPIIERENVFGSQVNRAARIEPVTTPGCVFASEQFAAALAVAAGHPFICEYVGVEELAKGYDRCALYLLGRH